MKKENGITLVMLIITIIIMLILTGITFYTGSNLLKKTRLQTIMTNMLLIEAKAQTIKDRVEFTKNEGELYGTLVEEPNDSEIASGVTEGKWYKWDQNTFNLTGLTGIDSDMVYYVNYETMEVIYRDGYTYSDGNIYYKLSDIKNLD